MQLRNSERFKVVLFAAVSLSASFVALGASTRTTFCDEINRFAAGELKAGGGHVELRRQGQWMVDHVKACERKQDDPIGIAFCDYLIHFTSTEFMEATINEAMACLQGQRLKGYVGNTGISEWDGKVRFYSPRIKVEGVEIEMSWHMTAGFGAWDDFLRISVFPSQ